MYEISASKFLLGVEAYYDKRLILFEDLTIEPPLSPVSCPQVAIWLCAPPFVEFPN